MTESMPDPDATDRSSPESLAGHYATQIDQIELLADEWPTDLGWVEWDDRKEIVTRLFSVLASNGLAVAASRPDVAPRCPAMADGVCTRYADGANWCEPGECPVAPLDGLADALLVAALDDLGGTLDRLEAMPSDPFYERSPEAEWTQDDAAPSYVEAADVAPQPEDG